MEALRFSRIVQDLEVDDAAFRHDMEHLTPANRSYVIFFSARSGSSWLTSVLSSTNRLGYPEEYLNPDFVREVAESQNTRDPFDLLQILKRKRKSPNGVFGIEVRHIDVELFGEDLFFEIFDPTTVFFHLWRENIVSQGVSLFRAVATQRFHSNSDRGKAAPPDYDAEAIIRWTRHVASTENANVRMLHRHGCRAQMLQYEGIVGDSAAAIEFFAKALQVPFFVSETAVPDPQQLTKIGDGWNIDVEWRFRREHPEFVAETENQRLITARAG